jgi:hypothetical protein
VSENSPTGKSVAHATTAIEHILVMAGLDPAIHVFVSMLRKQDVDHRDKPGDDD